MSTWFAPLVSPDNGSWAAGTGVGELGLGARELLVGVAGAAVLVVGCVDPGALLGGRDDTRRGDVDFDG